MRLHFCLAGLSLGATLAGAGIRTVPLASDPPSPEPLVLEMPEALESLRVPRGRWGDLWIEDGGLRSVTGAPEPEAMESLRSIQPRVDEICRSLMTREHDFGLVQAWLETEDPEGYYGEGHKELSTILVYETARGIELSAMLAIQDGDQERFQSLALAYLELMREMQSRGDLVVVIRSNGLLAVRFRPGGASLLHDLESLNDGTRLAIAGALREHIKSAPAAYGRAWHLETTANSRVLRAMIKEAVKPGRVPYDRLAKVSEWQPIMLADSFEEFTGTYYIERSREAYERTPAARMTREEVLAVLDKVDVQIDATHDWWGQPENRVALRALYRGPFAEDQTGLYKLLFRWAGIYVVAAERLEKQLTEYVEQIEP